MNEKIHSDTTYNLISSYELPSANTATLIETNGKRCEFFKWYEEKINKENDLKLVLTTFLYVFLYLTDVFSDYGVLVLYFYNEFYFCFVVSLASLVIPLIIQIRQHVKSAQHDNELNECNLWIYTLLCILQMRVPLW
jgi:hypothetical protein